MKPGRLVTECAIKQAQPTQEDPSNERMGIVAIWIRDITHTEHVKLLLASTSSCIDREQDWPGHTAADEADDGEHLQVSEEEIAVERLVLQDMIVGERFEVGHPAKKRRVGRWRLPILGNNAIVGARLIHATELPSKEKKGHSKSESDQNGRNECRDDTGQRVAGTLGVLLILLLAT